MTTSQPLRPQPLFPEPDTEPFWEATKNRELRYQTCERCDEVIFYPRAHCNACGSNDTTWNVSRGRIPRTGGSTQKTVAASRVSAIGKMPVE